MRVVINNINTKKEVIDVFKQIQAEVKTNERNSSDYFETDIIPVDKNGKEIKDFYKRVIDFGYEKTLYNFVNKLTEFGGRYWKDEETPMGLDAALAMALHSKHYITLFKNYLASTDLDHEVHQGDAIFEIIEKHGWIDKTYSLLIFAMYRIQGMEGYFPPDSLVEHVRDDEDELDTLYEAMDDERFEFSMDYGDDMYSHSQNSKFYKLLKEALLPPSTGVFKEEVTGETIFVDDESEFTTGEIKSILRDFGAKISEERDSDTTLIVSNDTKNSDIKVISFDDLVEKDAYISYIVDFTEKFEETLRNTDEEKLLDKLKNFRDLTDRINTDLISSYISKFSYNTIHKAVEEYGLGDILIEETHRNYGLLTGLYSNFEDTETRKIIDYLTEKGILKYFIDYETRTNQEYNYIPPLFSAVDSLRDEEPQEKVDTIKRRIQHLIKMGANPQELYKSGPWSSIPLLDYAIEKNYPNFDIIYHLIDNVSDINFLWPLNSDKEPLPHYSALSTAIKQAEYREPNFLDDEDDIQEQKEERDKFFNIVKKLVDKGIILKSGKNYNPFASAIKSKNIDVVKYLYEKGNFDLNGKGDYGDSLIYYAKDSREILNFLLENGADINGLDSLNRNLLFKAAEDNDVSMVKYLISKGINVNQRSNSGQTPLYYALNKYARKVCFELIHHGTDLTNVDNDGKTALEYFTDRYNKDKPYDEDEDHPKETVSEYIFDYLNAANDIKVENYTQTVDLNSRDSIERVLDYLVKATAQELPKNSGINYCSTGEELAKASMKLGLNDKLETFIRNLFSQKNLLRKTPLTILGFDEVSTMAYIDEGYLPLLGAFIDNLKYDGYLGNFYGHTESFDKTIKKYQTDKAFRIFINLGNKVTGIHPLWNLWDILGNSGETYDRFFSQYDDEDEKEYYDSAYERYAKRMSKEK